MVGLWLEFYHIVSHQKLQDCHFMLENDKHNQYVGEKMIYTILEKHVYLFGCCNIDDGTPVSPAMDWGEAVELQAKRKGGPGESRNPCYEASKYKWMYKYSYAMIWYVLIWYDIWIYIYTYLW